MRKLPTLLKSLWFWVVVVIVIDVAVAIFTWQRWDWLTNVNDSPSEVLRNVSLALAAPPALLLAVWRSIVGGRQAAAAQQQAETAQRSLLNERYQRGAEMLGHEYRSVRLAGIYALARLAREHSEEYHIQVMQVLCAFVRHPTRSKHVETRDGTLRDDVQAIMELIGSRNEDQLVIEKAQRFKLDLRGAQLINLSLKSPNLSEALFHGADLTHAWIVGVDSKAQLRSVDFEDADLSSAHIWMTDLSDSKFLGADLWDISLFGTDLSGVDFVGNRFRSRPAKGLVQEQLEFASANSGRPPRLEGVHDAVTNSQLVWQPELHQAS